MTALMKSLFMVGIALTLFACSLGGKPAVMVEQYALEYPPPAIKNLSPIDAVIRLDRFSVAQIFNHVKMVYRQKPTHYMTTPIIAGGPIPGTWWATACCVICEPQESSNRSFHIGIWKIPLSF
jgi:hypothetical protein